MLKRSNTLDKVTKVKKEIREVYLKDDKPWIIGYSGGKDSTTVLQLVIEVLFDLKKEGIDLDKKVYVISSDTLVENPMVIGKTLRSMENIKRLNKDHDLPVFGQMIYPKPDQSFLVNVIGRGYVVPLQSFRWCTDRIKINPANDFIFEKVDEDGEVILLLGTRKDESASRARSMEKHEVSDSLLSLHSQIENAWTYPVISDFTTEDVWNYLIKYPSPWGDDNHELYALYAESNADGECPLVIDSETKDKQTCGNSRFGCWTCTVVTKDKSLTGFIDNGNEWLRPLLDVRNNLVKNRDILSNRNLFDNRGNLRLVDVVVKDGVAIIPAKLDRPKEVIEINDDNLISLEKAYEIVAKNDENFDKKIVEHNNKYYRIGRSSYTKEHRVEMLREMMEAERLVRQEVIDYQIITKEEVVEIEKLWLSFGYITYSAIDIYNEYHEDKITPLVQNIDFDLLGFICENNDIDPTTFNRLINQAKTTKDLSSRDKSIKRIESLMSQHQLLLKEQHVD